MRSAPLPCRLPALLRHAALGPRRRLNTLAHDGPVLAVVDGHELRASHLVGLGPREEAYISVSAFGLLATRLHTLRSLVHGQVDGRLQGLLRGDVDVLGAFAWLTLQQLGLMVLAQEAGLGLVVKVDGSTLLNLGLTDHDV